MESVDLILTRDHYRRGASAMSQRFLRQARRGPFFEQAVTFLKWGTLGAGAAVLGRMAIEVGLGHSLAAEAEFALHTALVSAAALVPLSLLWFGACEFRARRALRQLSGSVDDHFPEKFDLHLRWSGDGIAWESELGSGGTPFAAISGYEEAPGLFLLYIDPGIFIPVPAEQLTPAQAGAMRAIFAAMGPPPLPTPATEPPDRP